MFQEKYQVIQSSTLFVQTPLVETMPKTTEPLNRIQTLLSALNSSAVSLEQNYRTFLQLAFLAKDVITSGANILNSLEVAKIYQLWELRLISLLFANELQLAQQEAKRFSTALDGIVKHNSPSNNHSNSVAVSMLLFPPDTPLSLRLLLIRLRSAGPNTTLLIDYYMQLWDARVEYFKTKDSLALNVIHLLAFSISASLIAKREYFTFLTHSDAILKKMDNTKTSDFGSRMTFLTMLASLVIGDASLAISYFDMIKDQFVSVLPKLQLVMNSVNPVLINEGKELENLTQEEIDITGFRELDEFVALVKNKRITGRILCSLCALFELDLRDQGGIDYFTAKHDELPEEYKTIGTELFTLWRSKTNKLYCFE